MSRGADWTRSSQRLQGHLCSGDVLRGNVSAPTGTFQEEVCCIERFIGVQRRWRSDSRRRHCFSRSLSTAPPLDSADTGTGVKVGRASEMGFISRWLPDPLAPKPASGTAAERGAKKGLDSPARLLAATAPGIKDASAFCSRREEDPNAEGYLWGRSLMRCFVLEAGGSEA